MPKQFISCLLKKTTEACGTTWKIIAARRWLLPRAALAAEGRLIV
jgi:hypothetical protein